MSLILVVDDEYTVAEMTSLVLEEEGYRVLTAANGQEALELLGECRPDLVLADLMMPYVDGVELCRAMRRDPALRAIPVVFMTAAPSRLLAGDCGHSAVLHKPVRVPVLLETIERIIGRPAESDITAAPH